MKSRPRRTKALADDERRKQLVGGMILDYMATNRQSALALALRNLVDAGLKLPADRALFPALADLPAARKPNRRCPTKLR
jgi:hypothetical protein